MSAVLNDEGLAQLLKLDEGLVRRLLTETDLPRLVIAGHRRFITEDVLSWLRTQGSVLPVMTVSEALEAPVRASDPLVFRAAEEDEVPFVSRAALSSLGRGQLDPSENLSRQQVRDALAAIGDALHAKLVRLSHDRLHPSPTEANRTSPWRLEPGAAAIDHVTMSWAEGLGAPGFEDRPHVALSVTAEAICLSVRGPSSTSAPTTRALDLAHGGAALMRVDDGDGWSIGRRYEIADGAPTAATLLTHLRADADTLVALWMEATGGGDAA